MQTNKFLSLDKESVLKFSGLSKLLDFSQDTLESDTQETIENAFDESYRLVGQTYTELRLAQFSSNCPQLSAPINFNFNDMKPEFVNKLLGK